MKFGRKADILTVILHLQMSGMVQSHHSMGLACHNRTINHFFATADQTAKEAQRPITTSIFIPRYLMCFLVPVARLELARHC